MLREPIALHQPGCDGHNCAPGECVLNVEDFARSILNDHIAGGAKRRNGTLTGPYPLSPADYDECLGELVGASWEAWRRFNPVDDGRGSNRLAGYIAWKLHHEITDWKRRRFKSTRYLTTPVVVMSYDDELGYATHYDADGPIGLRIDPRKFYGQVANAYRKVCKPLAESGYDPSADSASADLARFAVQTNQSLAWVHHALRIVRAELEQQGIRPSTMQQSEQVSEMEAVA